MPRLPVASPRQAWLPRAALLLSTLFLPSVAAADDGARPRPARTLAAFPVKTFLESVVTTPDGKTIVTSYPDGKIHSIDGRGQPRLLATIDGTIAGLAHECPGALLVSGWAGGKEPAVYRVSEGGKPELLLQLEGAMFPNGWSHLSGSRFLLADSFKGVIWEIDVARRSARVWLAHELLARSDDKSQLPGVNGLKIFGGALYASNGDRRLILKIPLGEGGSAGAPAVLVKDLFVDDFAFDERGNLYGATHLANSVVKVAPDGTVTTLGGLEQGLAGATAVAFGRSRADRRAILVTTNGGMSNPPPGGVQPGRVVRIEVNAVGAPLCH